MLGPVFFPMEVFTAAVGAPKHQPPSSHSTHWPVQAAPFLVLVRHTKAQHSPAAVAAGRVQGWTFAAISAREQPPCFRSWVFPSDVSGSQTLSCSLSSPAVLCLLIFVLAIFFTVSSQLLLDPTDLSSLDCSWLQIPQTTMCMEPDAAHETAAAVSVWTLPDAAAMKRS